MFFSDAGGLQPLCTAGKRCWAEKEGGKVQEEITGSGRSHQPHLQADPDRATLGRGERRGRDGEDYEKLWKTESLTTSSLKFLGMIYYLRISCGVIYFYFC